MTVKDSDLPPMGTMERTLALQRRRYKASPEQRERRRLAQLARRAADPEKYRKIESESRRRNAAVQRAKTNRRRNRRRALAAGNDHEPYTMAQVAERDEYACMICLAPVDMQLSGRDPMGPSIDHIIALVNGGPDSLANVQLAHLSCNCRKGSS